MEAPDLIQVQIPFEEARRECPSSPARSTQILRQEKSHSFRSFLLSPTRERKHRFKWGGQIAQDYPTRIHTAALIPDTTGITIQTIGDPVIALRGEYREGDLAGEKSVEKYQEISLETLAKPVTEFVWD